MQLLLFPSVPSAYGSMFCWSERPGATLVSRRFLRFRGFLGFGRTVFCHTWKEFARDRKYSVCHELKVRKKGWLKIDLNDNFEKGQRTCKESFDLNYGGMLP